MIGLQLRNAAHAGQEVWISQVSTRTTVTGGDRKQCPTGMGINQGFECGLCTTTGEPTLSLDPALEDDFQPIGISKRERRLDGVLERHSIINVSHEDLGNPVNPGVEHGVIGLPNHHADRLMAMPARCPAIVIGGIGDQSALVDPGNRATRSVGRNHAGVKRDQQHTSRSLRESPCVRGISRVQVP